MRFKPFRPYSFASRAFARFAFGTAAGDHAALRRLDPIALRHGLSPVLPFAGTGYRAACTV